MAATTVFFWSALAAAFLVLAVIARFEARAIKGQEHPLAGMPHVMIPTPVVRALRRILIVEAVGFVFAATAALFEAFWVQ